MATACSRPEAPAETDSEPGSEIANLRLRDHILKDRRPVHVEHLGADTIWSDNAIIERARKLPPPIEELVAAPPSIPDAAIAEDAMVQFLQDAERRKNEWRPAALQRKGVGDFDCEVSDGTTTASVNCIYANYVEARYPKATLQIKGAFEPVLLLVNGQLRGALMPMKR